MYRVVLIDDEQLILEGLSKVVKWADYGCQVIGTARDGKEGLALIQQEKPDIVFSDIRMPNMDGLTMLAALRSEFPHMLVTVLTAYRDFDYAQRALHLGVHRYLLKPSKMEELNEAIATMTARLAEMPGPRPSPKDLEPEQGEAGSFVVRAALDYMRQHCTERISLSDVADNVYVSQWHLSKLINRHTDQSFLELLSTMRIDLAKELLKDPSLRIHAIAEQVGYNDVAHFSKSFKKITGKTPVDYRSLLGEDK